MYDKEQFFKKRSVRIFCALISTALWGSAFPCVKVGYQLWQIRADDAAGQMIFAGIRFVLAGILTIIAAYFFERNCNTKNGWVGNAATSKTPRVFGYKRKKENSIRSLQKILFLGFIQTALQYVFYYQSMAHVSGVKGAIINGSSAFICVLMARMYYKEKEPLSGNRILGCVLGMMGVIIVNLGNGSLGAGWSWQGEGFMLVSVILSALGSLISKEAAKTIQPMTLCGGQLLSGGILLTVAGYAAGGHLPLQVVQTKGVLLLLYMAFISAAAFSLWTLLLKYNKMGEITVFNFMIPVFGTLLSALFLGESLWSPYILSSLPLVCIGIFLVNKAS